MEARVRIAAENEDFVALSPYARAFLRNLDTAKRHESSLRIRRQTFTELIAYAAHYPQQSDSRAR